MREIKMQLLFLVALLTLTGLNTWCQQLVIRDKTSDYVTLKGKAEGTTLLLSREGKAYLMDDKTGTLHSATPQEFSDKKAAWKYHLPSYLYSQTPSGALIWRKTKGEFYRQKSLEAPLVKISKTPPAFTKDDNGDNSPYFQFIDDNQGFVYFDNSSDVYQTLDGGVSWTHVGDLKKLCEESENKGFIRSMCFVSPTTGFAWIQMQEKTPFAQVASNDFNANKLARTNDGGKTWAAVKMGAVFSKHYFLGSLYFFAAPDDAQKISLYGYGDSIVYHSTNKGVSFTGDVIKGHQAHWNPKLKKNQRYMVDSENYFPFKIYFLR